MATPTVDEVWADFNVDGSVKEPIKQDIRRLLRFIQALAEAAGVGAKSYPTKAAMDADLSQPDGTLGLIYNDPVDANNFPTLWYWNDAGNVWVMGVDRMTALATAMAVLLPNAGIFPNVGTHPLEFADQRGMIPVDITTDGTLEMHVGAKIGALPFSVLTNATYLFAVVNSGGGVMLGFRHDGDVEVAGVRLRAINNGTYALAVTDKGGNISLGSLLNGDPIGGGGGGGLDPATIALIQALIAEMEAQTEFADDFQNTDATLSPPGGGPDLDSYAKQTRLFTEATDALIAGVEADFAAISGPYTIMDGPDAYATATAYVPQHLLTDSGITYLTVKSFTSSNVAADLAAGNMVVYAGHTDQNFDTLTAMPSRAALRAYGGGMRSLWLNVDGHNLRYFRDDGDTTTADDNGGTYVDALSRRWKLSPTSFLASTRCYEIFGADATAVADFDDELLACHAWANPRGLPVKQKSGRFLWHTAMADVKTDLDLAGMTVTTDGSSGMPEPDLDPPPAIGDVPQYDDPLAPWKVVGKARVVFDGTQLTTLNDDHADEMKKGSMRLTHPDLFQYRGGRVMYISSVIRLWRNGETSIPRQAVYYNDHAIIGRNGALDTQLIMDIPDGTVTYAMVTQREDSRLYIKGPRFEFNAARSMTIFRLQRPSVTLEGLSVKFLVTPQAVSARNAIRLEDTFDIEVKNCDLEANPGQGDGYGVMMLGAINVHLHNLTGNYGWGLTGNKWVKRLRITASHFNRLDAHESGYDWTVEDTTLRCTGFRVHGGGRHVYRNITWQVTPDIGVDDMAGTGPDFVEPALWLGRADYGNDFDGTIEFDGVRVVFDGPFLGWGLSGTGPDNLINATDLSIVRLGYPTIGNVQGDVSMPQSIKIRGVIFDCLGLPSIPDRIRFTGVRMVSAVNTANAGKLDILPERIEVDGMEALNVPAGSNAMMCPVILPDVSGNLTGMRQARRYDGTNLDVFISRAISVLNKDYASVPSGASGGPDGCATFFQSGPSSFGAPYIAATNRCVPNVRIRDCWPTIIETKGEGRIRIDGGTVARVKTNALAAFVDQATPSCQVDIAGAEVQLVPQTSGGSMALDVACTTFVGSTFKNHIGGGTAAMTGSYRGASNINRATAGVFPNVASGFFIA